VGGICVFVHVFIIIIVVIGGGVKDGGDCRDIEIRGFDLFDVIVEMDMVEAIVGGGHV
jgi:hypothetical protein